MPHREKLSSLEGNKRKRWLTKAVWYFDFRWKGIARKGPLFVHWKIMSFSKLKVSASVYIGKARKITSISYATWISLRDRFPEGLTSRTRSKIVHTLKTLMKKSSILLMPERPHVLLDQVVDESWYTLSSHPPRTGATELPDFGRGGAGDAHREGAQGTEQGTRAWPTDAQAPIGDSNHSNLPQYVRVTNMQEDDFMQSALDEYFCKGMDTSGPTTSWEQVLRRMEDGSLPDVGCLNSRAGVREEKWTSLNLRSLKFPSTVTSSMKRATLIPNFEADLIRAMGNHQSAALRTIYTNMSRNR